MRHATQKTLKMIVPILEQLRNSNLKEIGQGKFYKSSQAYLHFHEDERGIYADVKKRGNWHRVKVPDNKREWSNFAKKLLR